MNANIMNALPPKLDEQYGSDPNNDDKSRPVTLITVKITIGSWVKTFLFLIFLISNIIQILKGSVKPIPQTESFYMEFKIFFAQRKIRYEITQGSPPKVLLIEYDWDHIW